MRPSLAKLIEKVSISRHFEKPETDLHIAENACCIDYTDTWASKQLLWLSKSERTNCVNTEYKCEDPVEFETGVVWACLMIGRIHLQVASESKIQQLPATPHNTEWMDHHQVYHGSFKANLTPWMERAHTGTLDHAITVYNDIFDHMDAIIRALAKKKRQSKENLYFAMEVAQQMLSRYFAEVSSMTGLFHISVHILEPFCKLQSFRKWYNAMDIYAVDETSYTTQFLEAFLKYVGNK